MNRASYPLSSASAIPSKAPHYFTELTISKALLYVIAVIYVVAVAIISVLEQLIEIPCEEQGEKLEFENPAFNKIKCANIRYGVLLGLTRTECSFARRLVVSVVLGGLIGWERRQADRPAGIRTMSLVSLGSCLFTINSTFAFLNGPMNWDASRVSAAIPSGVGFLGAGLIFKKEEKSKNGDSSHVVHGLTTAASLWLSAAVGIACGGDLYFAASFGVAIMMLLLRFGPRGSEDGGDDESNADNEAIPNDVGGNERRVSYASMGNILHDAENNGETASLTSSVRTKQVRKRQSAALASIV